MNSVRNRGRYLDNIHRFLNRAVSVTVFKDEYMSLWRHDTDADWTTIETFPEHREKMRIVDRLSRGEITQEESIPLLQRNIAAALKRLGYEGEEAWSTLLNKLFTACDSHGHPDPRLCLSEEQLRDYVKESLAEYQRSRGK
jgi:hypothetical protein